MADVRYRNRKRCRVGAIYMDVNVPPAWAHFIPLNAERSAALIAASEGHIVEKKEPKEGVGCKKRG